MVLDSTVVVDGTVLLFRAVLLDGNVILHVRHVVVPAVSISATVVVVVGLYGLMSVSIDVCLKENVYLISLQK